jgi:hypothetical protein
MGNEEDRPIYDSGRNEPSAPHARRSIGFHAWVGGHTLLARDKVMPGLNLRFGARPVWVDLEGSFVWLTRRAPELDSSFLGNHLAAYLMFTAFRQKWFETRLGMGGDLFPLWNISANEWHRALSARATAQVRLWPRLEAFGTARIFLLHDDGLELGTTRGGRSRFPVLFSLGLAWRTE